MYSRFKFYLFKVIFYLDLLNEVTVKIESLDVADLSSRKEILRAFQISILFLRRESISYIYSLLS